MFEASAPNSVEVWPRHFSSRCFQIKGRNSYMTEAISIAIELDQDIMVTIMCVKFGEDWTNSFQELDRKT